MSTAPASCRCSPTDFEPGFQTCINDDERPRRAGPGPQLHLLAAAGGDDAIVPGQDPAERHPLRRGGRRRSIKRQRQHRRRSSTATPIKTKSFYDIYRDGRAPTAIARGSATRRLLHAGARHDVATARAVGARRRLCARRGRGHRAPPEAALIGTPRAGAARWRRASRRGGGGGARAASRRAAGPADRLEASPPRARPLQVAAALRVRAAFRPLPARRRRRVRRRAPPLQGLLRDVAAAAVADRVRLRDLPPLRHGRGRRWASATSSASANAPVAQRQRRAEQRPVDAEGDPAQRVGDLPLRLLPGAAAGSRSCPFAQGRARLGVLADHRRQRRDRHRRPGGKGRGGTLGLARGGRAAAGARLLRPESARSSTPTWASTTRRWCSSSRYADISGPGHVEPACTSATPTGRSGIMFQF